MNAQKQDLNAALIDNTNCKFIIYQPYNFDNKKGYPVMDTPFDSADIIN